LVYVSIADAQKVEVYKLNLKYSRIFNKWMTSQYAFFYLLNHLREVSNDEK